MLLWFRVQVERFIYLLVAGIDRDIGQSRMKDLPCVVKGGLSHSLLRPGRGRLGGVFNASNNWQETTARPRTTCCAARVVFPSATDLVGSTVTLLFYFLSLCVVMIYV